MKLTGLMLAGVLVLALAGCSRTVAVKVDPPFVNNLERLISASPHIVVAKAERVRPARYDKVNRTAVTATELRVETVYKGDLQPESRVTVTQLGGRVGLKTYEVFGVRYLEAGTRYLLFLYPHKDGTMGQVAYMQTHFPIDANTTSHTFYGLGGIDKGETFTLESLKERAARQ